VLEILCDQKPWGETYTYDEHFRFGPFKARMIVAAQSVIADFVESEGNKPLAAIPLSPMTTRGILPFLLLVTPTITFLSGAIVWTALI
jgi:hypothetical protein